MVLLVSSIAGLPPILVFSATGLPWLIREEGYMYEGTNTGTGPAIFQFMGFAWSQAQLPNAGIFNDRNKVHTRLATGFTIAVLVRIYL